MLELAIFAFIGVLILGWKVISLEERVRILRREQLRNPNNEWNGEWK